jgi:hypothetical protein
MQGKKESVKNKAWVAMEQPTDLRSFSIRGSLQEGTDFLGIGV